MPTTVAVAVAALLITLLITIVIAVTLVLTLVGERRELRELRKAMLNASYDRVAEYAPATPHEATPVTNVLDSPYDGS